MNGADVVVIGGGWSGLAAAIELQRSGLKTTLVEAAPQLGGRARRVNIDLGFGTVPLDNGQHLLIGAYRETLALMRRIGVDPEQVLRRERMQLVRSDGLRLRAARMPAPLHLLIGLAKAGGFAAGERQALIRLMLRLRLARWRVAADERVLNMLQRLRQPETLIRRLWAPFCVAALNTPAKHASAQVFACVLRDSLGAGRAACDFLLPRTDLSACLPDPGSHWLQKNGAQILTNCTVRRLQRQPSGWTLTTDRGSMVAAAVVLALPSRGALRLLEPLLPTDHPLQAALSAERFEAIRTVYLAWPQDSIRSVPDWVMLDDQEPFSPGQWLFDRGIHMNHRIAAVIVSAADREVTPAQLGDQIREQVQRQLRLPRPTFARVITERYATFQAVSQRPLASWPTGTIHAALAEQNLWLAGDYLEPEYPATIESAVRGGLAAARALHGARLATRARG
jgi:squalene-associated FAD-dependent desaturase